jgi:hypothetical protein
MSQKTTFYDVKIRGNKWELPTCVFEEVLATGQKWRLYVGNAHSAVEIHDTGSMISKEKSQRIVRYVINCAFAEYPYNRLNSRQDITYANVITKDCPQPLVTNEKQRPCWNSSWDLIQLSRNGTNSSEDINVLCHCVYGWNRSVSTAAIILRLLKGWSIDSAISHMKRLKKVHVMLVYSQWAQQFIDNFPAEQLISISSSSSSSSNEKRQSFFRTPLTEITQKRDCSDIDNDSTFSSSSSSSNKIYDRSDIRNSFGGSGSASKIQRISGQSQCDMDISLKPTSFEIGNHVTSSLVLDTAVNNQDEEFLRAIELSKMEYESSYKNFHNRGTRSNMVLDLTDID